MKTCLRRLISTLLVFCLCLSIVPATAQAAGEKPAINDVAATKISGTNGDVVVTTSKVVLENLYDYHYFYAMADTTGLTDVSGYWKLGFSESTNTSYLDQNEVSLCSWRMSAFPSGWKTVTVTVYDNNDAVYGTGTLEVYFAAQDEYPMTDAEAAAAAGAQTVPAGTISLDVHAYFGPTSAVTEETKVYVELLDRSGTVYGATHGSDYGSIYESSVNDTRFDAVFQDYSPYTASCMSVSAYLLCGRELVPGMYSLHFYTEDQSFEKTVPNAVEVTNSLMADMYYGNGFVSYDEELGLAGTTVRIINGSPSDFQVQLVRGETVLAVSNAYRPVEFYYGGELVMQYYIPVSPEDLVDQTVLDRILAEWGVSSLDDLTPEQREMVMSEAMGGLYDLTLKLVSVDGTAIVGETKRSFEEDGEELVSGFFASHFYANAVLVSTGLDTEETYKLTLTNPQTDVVLSELLVSPDENGIFDVEFTDENGEVIALDTSRWRQYQIQLYQKKWNGDWNSYSSGSIWLSTQQLRTTYAASLLSEEQTLPLNIYVGMNILEDGRISFYVDGNADDLQKLTDCELHLTPVGSSKTIVLDDVDYSEMEDTALYGYGWLYFCPEEPLTNGYYTGKLYCGDKLVTDLEGIDIMADERLKVTDTIGGSIYGTYLQDNPLLLNYSAELENADEVENARLDFYTLGNRTGTPDKSFVLDSYYSFDLTAEQLAELGNDRYQAVLWADDTPVDVTDYEFWMASEQMHEYRTYYWENDQVMRFGASVDPAVADKAQIELIPCFGGTDANGDFQAFTEVYVKVTPAKGQILDKILVNGKPITGHAFLLTSDDTVVSASFKAAKQYTITTSVYDYDQYVVNSELASIEVSASAAMPGETITVAVTPKDGYMLEGIDVRSSSGNIETTTLDDGTRSFVMPEDNVTIRAYVRIKQSMQFSLNGGGTYGTLAVTPADGLLEGDAFTLTVDPADGYYLTNLTMSYNDRVTYEYVTQDLLDTPTTETFAQEFSGLATTYVTVKAEFAALTSYKVGISTGMIGGTIEADKATANPGEMVTLTVKPNESYRQNGDIVIPYTTTSGQKYVTPTENEDGTWSFLMPWGDVYISTSFILVGPGGEVRTPEELHLALGGNHSFDETTGTVKLSRKLILEEPITVLGDVGTLNLNGYSIGGPAFSEDEAPVGVFCIGENGALHITGNSGNIKPDGTGSHAIQVLDGELTVDGAIYLYSVEATEMDTVAAIMVEGGTVTLGKKGDVQKPNVYGQRCADGVRITDGDVTILSGTYYGGKEFSYAEIMGDASLMGGMEDGGYDGSSRGGSGVHVSDTGSLRIDDGYFVSGLNQAGVKISDGKSGAATGKIRIRGGQFNPEYYENYGHGLWVNCQPADLVLSGGLYRYSYNYYGFDHAIQLKNIKLSAYLAAGVEVVDPYDNKAMSAEQTYYYYGVKLIPPADEILAEDLSSTLNDLENMTDEEEKKTAVAGAEDNVTSTFNNMGSVEEKEAAMANENLAEQIAKLEEAKNAVAGEEAVTVEVSRQSEQIAESGNVEIIGAVLNAEEKEVKLVIADAADNRVPAGYQNDGVQLSLTLEGVTDTDETVDGTQLAIPVKITLPLPEGVNPAYVAVLHVGEETTELHSTVDLLNNTITFITASFSDFILTEAVSAVTTDGGVSVMVANFHDTGVTMACAVYNADGKQIGVEMVSGTELNDGVVVACDSAQADHVKLFLLEDGNRPAYASEEIKLS